MVIGDAPFVYASAFYDPIVVGFDHLG